METLDNLVDDCEEDDFTTSQYSEGFALYEKFDDACLEDLADYKPIIDKVRRIVRFFKLSPLKNEFLQTKVRFHQAQQNIPQQDIKLILDCKTRWNSLISMLDKILLVSIFIVI